MPEATEAASPLIQNDAVLFGILMLVLGAVFYTAARPDGFWKKFYGIVPSILLCYFLPSLLTTFGLVDPDGSQLYFVASRYLLPTSLVLLTLSIDLEAIMGLGPKAIVLFLTGTAGIVIGGPVSLWLVGQIFPAHIDGETWKGLATVAGSWIGGGANQAAMLEIFGADEKLYSACVTVDVIVANIWMAVLLLGAGRSHRVDAFNKADASAVIRLQSKVAEYQAKILRIPKGWETMTILAVGFVVTGFAHFGSDLIAPAMSRAAETRPVLQQMSLTSGFFWLIVIATTIGVGLSFTRARSLEGAGASRLGSVMIYILVATIGLKMDLTAIFETPVLFLIGLIWISIHAVLLIVVARLIRAPLFFMAVGSQANVGGAASAPIVASAFHPALAPVGVLLAVLGYALGTYAAWGAALLMRAVSGS